MEYEVKGRGFLDFGVDYRKQLRQSNFRIFSSGKSCGFGFLSIRIRIRP